MNKPINYTDLPGFDGTCLEDSYVLGIRATPGALSVTLDLMIGWAHPSYRDPLEGEVACFRKAEIAFPSVRTLVWEGQGAPPAVDSSGEEDWGGIDTLHKIDTTYRLQGDFGRIEVTAHEPTVRIIGE